MNRHHMGLVQPGCSASLPPEPLLKNLVVDQVRGQHFQSNDSVDGGVVRTPDFAHAAAAQHFYQPIATKRRALHMSPSRISVSGHNNPRCRLAMGRLYVKDPALCGAGSFWWGISSTTSRARGGR